VSDPRDDPRYDPRAALLVLVGIVSVQAGAAAATTLFDEIGPAGTVFLRALFAALVLLPFARIAISDASPAARRNLVSFGVVLAGMNLCFYESLDRLPLGIAVTLEFVGPLGVALIGSRRPRDLVWALLAGAGILLLSGGVGGTEIDALGAAFALAAGGFWAAYILINARVGAAFPGIGGLAWAMALAAVLLSPFGLVGGGGDLADGEILAVGFAVGLLSSAIPYALELEALRRLPNAVFGVLMSLEPAAAALIGLVALDQGLAGNEVVAIVLVVIASAGALRNATGPAPRDA
jgi:inner membrane transporter RhtA